MRRPVSGAAVLALSGSLVAAGPAHAHAFRSGLDYYEQFQEGVGVVFAYPGTLFPIVALGVMVGLWQADGIVRSAPVFVAGLFLGVPLAAFVGPSVATGLIGLGVTTAVLAALLPHHHRAIVWSLAAATAVLVSATSLEGHGFLELPVAIHVGILLAALFAFIASANATRLSITRFASPVTAIVFRIAASWIAAALVLFLAFQVRG